MGHRRDVRQRYNIEGSGGSDLYDPFHPFTHSSANSLVFCVFLFFRVAFAPGAASLACSRRSRAKSSLRSTALLVATTRKVFGRGGLSLFVFSLQQLAGS